MQSHFKEKVLERLRKVKSKLHANYFEFKDLEAKFKTKILPFLKEQKLANDPDIKAELSEISNEFDKINEMAKMFQKINFLLGKNYEIEKVELFKE